LPRLPLAFACLHIAYGAGFFAGTGDLLRRHLVRTAEDARRTGLQSPT
jgi:hypothetical protein